MNFHTLIDKAKNIKESAKELIEHSNELETAAKVLVQQSQTEGFADPFIMGLSVFMLACFVGYYVVWRVTPALHSPLMAVTNAISSVIIIGALLAAGHDVMGASRTLGFFAVLLASVNIFGGFIVTNRMLAMFRQSK